MNHDIRHGVAALGEEPVYPGHPVTCALIVLHAYKGRLSKAWEPWRPPQYPWLRCESELNTPTAGGNLTTGCALIRHVLDGKMTPEQAIAWGDERWGGAGGLKDKVKPGQEQADRFKDRLLAELRALAMEVTT
jgi:hypothetical protein